VLVERLRVALVPALNGVGAGRGAESHEFLGYGLPEVTGYLLIIVLPTCISCRPLNCSKGLLKVPKSSGTFVGHLSLHNIKIGQKQREEQVGAFYYNYILRCFPFFGLIFFACPFQFSRKR